MLIDVFNNRIKHFIQRLDKYTRFTPTGGMTDILVEIMAEVINILAIVAKEAKGRLLSELMSFIFTNLDSHIF
jgi:hypothetical protein